MPTTTRQATMEDFREACEDALEHARVGNSPDYGTETLGKNGFTGGELGVLETFDTARGLSISRIGNLLIAECRMRKVGKEMPGSLVVSFFDQKPDPESEPVPTVFAAHDKYLRTQAPERIADRNLDRYAGRLMNLL